MSQMFRTTLRLDLDKPASAQAASLLRQLHAERGLSYSALIVPAVNAYCKCFSYCLITCNIISYCHSLAVFCGIFRFRFGRQTYLTDIHCFKAFNMHSVNFFIYIVRIHHYNIKLS